MKKFALIILILSLCGIFASCGGGNEPVLTDYPEREVLVAEVGYTFELPRWLTASGSGFTVKDLLNNALEVKNNSVYFANRGEYTLTYTQGGQTKSVPVEVVDTKPPMFYPLWDTYSFMIVYPVNVEAGGTVHLGEIFRAYDNSGEPVTVSFVLWKDGAFKVDLVNGETFIPELGAYYIVEARAKDTSGNVTLMEQRLTVIAA